jgi:hypothetical protein
MYIILWIVYLNVFQIQDDYCLQQTSVCNILFFFIVYANLSCSNARLDPEILPTSVDFPTAIALVLESEERINATQIV